MPQKVRIIGVPMDLGQSRRGVDMGPSALRGAGLQVAIKKLGHTVVAEASDGLQAIEATRLHKPDVVIMDIKMPVLDGIEAARTILAETPCAILFLSSFNEQEEHEGENHYFDIALTCVHAADRGDDGGGTGGTQWSSAQAARPL